MGRLSNSIVSKLLLLVCVAMQAVVVMPHHHHGDSVHLCLDSGHIAASDDKGDLPVAHVDHSQPYAVCPSHSIVMARPDMEEDALEAAEVDHCPGCCCPCCASVIAAFITENRVAVVFNGSLGQSDLQPYLRVYLTDALPCRAPDLMC